MNTVELEMAKRKDEIDRRIMDAMVEDFYKRWCPGGADDSRFATDLHMLVRQIYREAQEPAFKQLEIFIRALPIVPFLADPPRKAG
jgi:hypothetical protein